MSESGAISAPRVVVGVSGSPGSLTALCRAVEEARRRGAELWPVLAWEPPEGDLPARRSPYASFMVDELQRRAREKLVTALGEVFGVDGPALPMRALVARGAPGWTLVEIADGEGDVLVIGAGRRGRLRRALRPSVSRYCLAHATCPVLAVPPSPLEAGLRAVHRRNVLGLRLDMRRARKEFETVPPVA
ncbi:universal stress protein [Streptomyces sp. NPDC058964]|uniref:universal stress protein n=1 Tax=Streptomyces sp. NPDC058964 TaxID=3346681 RepID=UPI0036CC6C72